MLIEIRRVSTTDIDKLQNICRITFADTFKQDNSQADLQKYLDSAYSFDVLEKELAEKQSAYFFAYLDEEVVGYLKLNWGQAQTENKWLTALEIQRIYVHPNYQKHGIGKRLFEFTLNYARTLSVDGIWLGVWKHNTNALGFYKHLGFKQDGEHTFVLGNDCQTDLLMYRSLKS